MRMMGIKGKRQMKNLSKKRWTGKPKEKGQVFHAKVHVGKMNTKVNIPSVLTINKEDYTWVPSRVNWTGKPKAAGQIFSAKITVKKVIGGESGIPSVITINGEEYTWRPKK